MECWIGIRVRGYALGGNCGGSGDDDEVSGRGGFAGFIVVRVVR